MSATERKTDEPEVDPQRVPPPVTQILYIVDGRLVNSWGQPVDDTAKVTGRTLGTPPPPPGPAEHKAALIVGNGGMAYVNLTPEDMAIIAQAEVDVKATIPPSQQAPKNVIPAVPEEPQGAWPPELQATPLPTVPNLPHTEPDPEPQPTASTRSKKPEA